MLTKFLLKESEFKVTNAHFTLVQCDSGQVVANIRCTVTSVDVQYLWFTIISHVDMHVIQMKGQKTRLISGV